MQKTNDAQQEEMMDSWLRGANRKNRGAHNSPNRSDISPMTTPMVESTSQGIKIEAITQESASLKDDEHSKHEAEMTAAAAAPLDDDMDFRWGEERDLLKFQQYFALGGQMLTQQWSIKKARWPGQQQPLYRMMLIFVVQLRLFKQQGNQ